MRELEMSESLLDDNPTRAYVAEAVSAGRRNVPLEVNPALASLSALLVEARDGELVIRFTAPQSATQGNGVVGGGTLASMLDLAMAMAVLSRLKPGYTCATISLAVNMQSAGQQGHFLAVAGVDRVGRQIAFAHAKLYDPERSRTIANATSSLAVIPVRG
ncbi:PaaI family thioesterase [Ramlibacter henchirensis]|uniref:PaaI family thioesterase n=1 Tax=Ramlibacter henchirensis TaxID=204072 RepID=A0A4Z0BVB4_9BURK|nr:PaaI family thioesterase [Ramlibacter henchirensis]TFZ02791.1 PaaI family thioesterase [Ramlibacter henchirensis]